MRNVIYTIGITGVVVGIAAYKLIKSSEERNDNASKKEVELKKDSKTKYFNSILMSCQLAPFGRYRESNDISSELSVSEGKLFDLNDSTIKNIFSFVDVVTIAKIKMVCKSWRDLSANMLEDKNYLRNCVKEGFDPKLRGKIWMYISKSSIESLMETRYAKKKIETDNFIEKQRIDEIRLKDIKKDIKRTIKSERNLKINEEKLKNILIKYCSLDEKVGYVQGMNFVAAKTIRHLNENEAFAMLKTLMFEYDMRSSYYSHLPRLKMNLYSFDCFLKEYAPHIWSRLRKLNIKVGMFASEWFLTLFNYNTSEKLSDRIWDCFVVEGWPILHAIGVTLLLRNAVYLSNNSFENTLRFLKSLIVPDDEIKNVLQQAFLLDIKDADLDYFHRQFVDMRIFLRM